MNQDELTTLFDQQAEGYDSQWAKTSPIRDCLHLLLESMFIGLPENARILCIGVGTGAEMVHLARKNLGWQFTAVDPSSAMLRICREKMEKEGFRDRCNFHEGYLMSLDARNQYDAATCFLVSQFILDQKERAGFFGEIANKLKPGAILTSTDLASDIETPEYEVLLKAWMSMMAGANIAAEDIERIRKAYANDVGVLSPDQIKTIIQSGGFQTPVQFFQAGLIHGWISRRP